MHISHVSRKGLSAGKLPVKFFAVIQLNMLGRHYRALWPVAKGVKGGTIGAQSISNSGGVRTGISIFPSSTHIGSQRNEKFFSAQPRTVTEEDIPSLQSTKPAPNLSRLQEECWDAYKSTGRGCLTLFQLIDTDYSNTISCADILLCIRTNGVRMRSGSFEYLITFFEDTFIYW